MKYEVFHIFPIHNNEHRAEAHAGVICHHLPRPTLMDRHSLCAKQISSITKKQRRVRQTHRGEREREV